MPRFISPTSFDPHAEAIEAAIAAAPVGPTVDDTHNPPSRPVRVQRGFERVTSDPHGYRQIFRNAIVIVSTIVIVASCVGFGYWWAAVTR